MARNEDDSVLHFECDSCGTHLGVDGSLAGLEAPCPKCGKLLTAPLPRLSGDRIPSSGVTRGVSGGKGFQTTSRPREATEEKGSTNRGERKTRKVYANSGRMANEDEKENLRVLIKILIATALVALVVALVVWYLKSP